MKTIKKPATKPKLKKSMLYMFVYEHIHGGMVRKGNYFTCFSDQYEIENELAIRTIESTLKDGGKVDPVVIDWIAIKVVDVP